MQGLLFRRIPPENEKRARDFFRDAREFGPEDVERFLSSTDAYASRRGKIATFEQSFSDRSVAMDLWLESAGGPNDTISRLFRLHREGAPFPRGGGRQYLVGTGPFYISRDMSKRIPPDAVKVSAAVMNTDVERLANMLRNLRIVLTSREPERVSEARYDLERECTGSRIWHMDLYSGRRFEVFPAS